MRVGTVSSRERGRGVPNEAPGPLVKRPLERFVYREPIWSLGDRLIACIEVASPDAHNVLHEGLGLPGQPRWFHEWRVGRAQVQTFGMAWRIEVGPEDAYGHLGEADWDHAQALEASLGAARRTAEWPDTLLDALLPTEETSLLRRPPSGDRLGHFRSGPARIDVAIELADPNSHFKVLPIGPRTVVDGSPSDGSVVEASTTQDKLPDGSFGLVAKRVVVHCASRADIASAEPAARFLRALGGERDAREHVRQWIFEKCAAVTELDLDGWLEAAARRAVSVRHLDVVRGPESAISQHLAFLDAYRLSLDLDAMKCLAAWTAEIEAGRRWDQLRPDAMLELARVGAATAGLGAYRLPPAHSLGAGLLLSNPTRLAEANSAGLLLGAQSI